MQIRFLWILLQLVHCACSDAVLVMHEKLMTSSSSKVVWADVYNKEIHCP